MYLTLPDKSWKSKGDNRAKIVQFFSLLTTIISLVWIVKRGWLGRLDVYPFHPNSWMTFSFHLSLFFYPLMPTDIRYVKHLLLCFVRKTEVQDWASKSWAIFFIQSVDQRVIYFWHLMVPSTELSIHFYKWLLLGCFKIRTVKLSTGYSFLVRRTLIILEEVLRMKIPLITVFLAMFISICHFFRT